MRRIDSDLVFPGRRHATKPVDLRGPFKTAIAKAGIADSRWHRLRHTAARYRAMNGASLAGIRCGCPAITLRVCLTEARG